MTETPRWSILILILLVFILSFGNICISNSSSDDPKPNTDQSDQDLEILYLGVNYLLPNKPGHAQTNKTGILAQNHSLFGHNIYDRKFNEKLIPELNLWLHDYGNNDIKLEFEILFQAVEDNTIIPNKKYTILFYNHTTSGNGTTSPELVKIPFHKYVGKPFDIKMGSSNWCTIQLTIRRIDNISNSKIDVYCGAEGKISHIIVPYDQTLSAYNYEKEKEKQKDNNSTPGFYGHSMIFAICAISLIFYFFNSPMKRRSI